MYKIFLVEDNIVIANQIKKHLESWNYKVIIAEDFHDVMKDFAAAEADLVLLDISLPFFDGFYWCRKIRQISKLPIIFLSGASDNLNIVMAMNLGADDFICKPFDFNVLTAKLQALLRRVYDFNEQVDADVIEHKGMILNLRNASLYYEDEKIELTKNEYRILELLLKNKGEITSRDDLMMVLWNTDSFVDENTLTVNMTRLRKKLSEHNISDFIKTKKGLGYIVE
ncbi:MAG: response regulator transcription factor [Eubacterium sp.]|nr:response regulator transcription factor [Eubacterium sp.]